LSGYNLADEAGQVRAYNHLLGDTGFTVPHILRNQKEESVKIVVRQEESTLDGSQTTCVWSIGDDGETLDTVYLDGGQQVDIEIGTEVKGDAEQGQVVDPSVTFGEVGPIAVPSSDEKAQPVAGISSDTDQKAGERPGEDDEPGGANDTSVLR
jgi:hypothetical protein